MVIGPRTVVWARAVIDRGSQIGCDCVVGRNAYIDGAEVGDGCKIQNDAYLPPGVHLEPEVFVGPYAKFANERYPKAVRGPDDPPFIPKGAHVCRGASIGMDARIGAEVTIGEQALIGMGAIVPKDVAAGATVYGPKPRYGNESASETES